MTKTDETKTSNDMEIAPIGVAVGEETTAQRGLQARIDYVSRNTAEVLTAEDLKKMLEAKSNPTAYYGTAPTGPVHIGYLIPLSKLFDFEKAGITSKILLADIHASLDDQKSTWDELDRKVAYYQKCIEFAFPWSSMPRFFRGSSFQLEKPYMMDTLKMSSIVTINRATRAASEVTRMKDPKIGELIYPIMQALDEQYLDVDLQLGGTDQRHIMTFAREYLEALGYRMRVEVMTPLLVSLQGPGVKMSASIPLSHIKVYESEKSIKEKISKAYCPESEVKDNPILQITRFLVLGVNSKIMIERPQKFGGDLEITSYGQLEQLYSEKKIHPMDLKNTVIRYLTPMFKRARDYFESNQDMLKELGDIFLSQ